MYQTLEIGVRAHDLPAATPAELCALTKKMDISYVQLALRKSFSGIQWTNHTFSPGLAEKIKRDLGGLRVSVLGSYIDPLAEGEARENEKAVFIQNMLFAKYLNAGVVGTETGMSDHSEADYQKTLSFVRELAEVAEKLGVMIGIEGVACHSIYSPAVMKRLLDEVDSPNVMTIFDPVNFISTENYLDQDDIILEPFLLYPEKIAAIHIKDFDVIDGTRVTTRPGKGIFHTSYLLDCIQKYKPQIDLLIEEGQAEHFLDERAYILQCANQ